MAAWKRFLNAVRITVRKTVRAYPRIAAFRGSVVFNSVGSRRLAPGRIARGNGESNESAPEGAAEGVD